MYQSIGLLFSVFYYFSEYKKNGLFFAKFNVEGPKNLQKRSEHAQKGNSRKKTEHLSLFNTLSFPNPH